MQCRAMLYVDGKASSPGRPESVRLPRRLLPALSADVITRSPPSSSPSSPSAAAAAAAAVRTPSSEGQDESTMTTVTSSVPLVGRAALMVRLYHRCKNAPEKNLKRLRR